MPTAPFSTPRLNQIKARQQATRTKVILKEVRVFSAYCCNINAAGIMGVAKEPVPVVNISPNPVCLGEAITWDLTGSYAPGSTINSWEIDFGDGNSASGSNIALATGSHVYEEEDTYEIEVEISEGGGKDQDVTYQIEVVECLEEPGVLGTSSYVSFEGGGVWYIDWLIDPPVWLPRNTGLTENAKNVRSLVIAPHSKHKPSLGHELWIATLDGVWKSGDGGRHWAKQNLPDPSNIEFEDENPPAVEQLDFHHIVFDPNDDSIVYILASYTPEGS